MILWHLCTSIKNDPNFSRFVYTGGSMVGNVVDQSTGRLGLCLILFYSVTFGNIVFHCYFSTNCRLFPFLKTATLVMLCFLLVSTTSSQSDKRPMVYRLVLLTGVSCKMLRAHCSFSSKML